eukprot:TRINITY_DN348_c0_g2_i1.p1 TRINITY_DN348_c0_g2~~TRINITY_DN348_c0_g2_i1.p1  ORF type:complete len:380 (-),score=69.39 TRINITY_DN348_c0_g2_i1:72-1211(-)
MKDWIAIIIAGNQYTSTPSTPQIINRIKWISVISRLLLPAFIIGGLLTINNEEEIASGVIIVIFICSCIILVGLLYKVKSLFVDIDLSAMATSSRPEMDQMQEGSNQQSNNNNIQSSSSSSSSSSSPSFYDRICGPRVPWRVYYNQTTFLASVAYILTNFNLLGPNPIFIGYLATIHTNFSALESSILYGLISSTGVIPYLFSYASDKDKSTNLFLQKFGSTKLFGLTSIWASFVILLVSVLPLTFGVDLYWVCFVPIILSRFFVTNLEISHQQLIMDAIPECDKKVHAGLEYVLVNMIGLLSYAFGITLAVPKNFPYLALGSTGVFGLGVFLYTFWYFKQGKNILQKFVRVDDQTVQDNNVESNNNNVDLSDDDDDLA